MSFTTRNTYHLRLSAHSVLPLYLYLDERHVEWMTNATLQKVLTDLQPLILPKLQAEQHTGLVNSKKGSVDVHRGEDYQFAFFIRKVDSQSNVLIKTRQFVPAKAITRRAESPAPVILGKRKRNAPTAPNKPLKDEPGTEVPPTEPEIEEDNLNTEGQREPSPTGSEYREEFEQEEEKPKMELQLSYQGYSIFGRCLCVVVEPYPPTTASVEKPKPPPIVERPLLQRASRAPSERPRFREETPLFLPEIELPNPDSQASPIFPDPGPREFVNSVPANVQRAEQSGMLSLTQMLQNTAMYRIDSDSDGDEAGVFLGDAEASRDIF